MKITATLLTMLIPLLMQVSRVNAEANATLHPNDFAYGFKIEATRSPIQAIEIPLTVFATAQNDLSDVRIFNSKGDMLAMQIRRGQTEENSEKDERPLPHFPLYGENIKEQTRQIILQDGTVIFPESNPQSEKKLTAYLLNNSNQPKDLYLSALTIQFDSYGDILNEFYIEESDDLIHWQTNTPKAVVSRLYHAGEWVEINRVTISPTRAKFLRLVPFDRANVFKIFSVTGDYEKNSKTNVTNTLTINDFAVNKNNNTIEFNAPKNVPILGIEVLFKPGNYFLKGELFSTNEFNQWESVRNIFQYQFEQNDQRYKSPVDTIYYHLSDHWKIQIWDGYSAALDAVESVILHWQPQTLVFLAQGDGPYTLAFGNPQIRSIQQDNNKLLREDDVGQAKIVGDKFDLGGAEKLVLPFNWQRVVLYAILGLGALLLAFMALRLFKDLKQN